MRGVLSIFPPQRTEWAGDVALLEAAAGAIVRLFELGASMTRESAQRDLIETDSKRRIEEFRTCMGLLEKQLESSNNLELDRQQSYFAIANKLVELGHIDGALGAGKSVEGRQSVPGAAVD